MKPMHFVVLAILAAVSTALAITSYAANNTWSPGRVSGARMFPALASNAGTVAAIELRQGPNVLTLEKAEGGHWRLKERGGYPVPADKVRTLMVSLAEADLVEAKTRVADRYGLIDLEEPTGAGAKSRSVRLLDAKGSVLAEAVVGKKRSDAFGFGKSGTYVRKPGDAQTWLANADLDVSADLKDWVKTDVFQIDSSKVSRVTVEMPGEQPLKIERNADKKLTVAGIPQGQKLKDEGTADSIARAAAYIDFDDVRKQTSSAAPKDVSTIKLETDNGLTGDLAPAQGWRRAMAVGDGRRRGRCQEGGRRDHGTHRRLGIPDQRQQGRLAPQAPRRPVREGRRREGKRRSLSGEIVSRMQASYRHDRAPSMSRASPLRSLTRVSRLLADPAQEVRRAALDRQHHQRRVGVWVQLACLRHHAVGEPGPAS